MQRAGQVVLILVDAQLGRAGQHHRRVRADHHGHLQVPPVLFGTTEIVPGVLTAVEAGTHSPRSLDLQPDIRQVADAGVRVARSDHPRRDIRAGVLDEVARDRQPGQIGVISLPDHFLHRAGLDDLGGQKRVQLAA